jgi:hypothetical protein
LISSYGSQVFNVETGGAESLVQSLIEEDIAGFWGYIIKDTEDNWN